jgi:hypothetical protein
MDNEIVLYYHSAFHHEFDTLQFTDVRKGITGDCMRSA